MIRNPFASLARDASPRPWARLAVVVLVVLMAAGCDASLATPTFALAFHNGSDNGVRVNVVVTAGQRPTNSLRVPARSGVVETATIPMDTANAKAVPVVVEIYTKTCSLLTSITVGAGATLVSVGPDLAVTTAATTLTSGSGTVAPETAAAC